MKKYTSILMLYARSTIFRLLGILVLTGAVETGLFCLAMDPALPLEQVFSSSHIPLACGVAFLLWTVTLSLPQFTKADYTLRRMQLKPRALYLCHAVYNTLCYVLFWCFHTCLLLILFHWFGTTADEVTFGPQSIMLAFYRIDFLHSLLPLADWTRYLRNSCMALLLGAAAAYPLSQRGKHSSQLIMAFLALITLWLFPSSMGNRSMDWFLSVVCVVLLVLFIVCTGTRDEKECVSTTDMPEVPAPDIFKEVHEDEI